MKNSYLLQPTVGYLAGALKRLCCLDINFIEFEGNSVYESCLVD